MSSQAGNRRFKTRIVPQSFSKVRCEITFEIAKENIVKKLERKLAKLFNGVCEISNPQ